MAVKYTIVKDKDDKKVWQIFFLNLYGCNWLTYYRNYPQSLFYTNILY
jgi:hypothetical protein